MASSTAWGGSRGARALTSDTILDHFLANSSSGAYLAVAALLIRISIGQRAELHL